MESKGFIFILQIYNILLRKFNRNLSLTYNFHWNIRRKIWFLKWLYGISRTKNEIWRLIELILRLRSILMKFLILKLSTEVRHFQIQICLFLEVLTSKWVCLKVLIFDLHLVINSLHWVILKLLLKFKRIFTKVLNFWL